MNRRRGKLVTLIGIHGSGKTTLVEGLREKLHYEGLAVASLHSRPYFSWWVQDRLAEDGIQLNPEERLTFTTLDHMRQLVWEITPLLETNDIVLADRYLHCMLARAMAASFSETTLRLLNGLVKSCPTPDHLIWIDTPATASVGRIQQRSHRKESLQDLEKLEKAYRQLSTEFAFARIDGAQPKECVFKQVYTLITDRQLDREPLIK